MTLRIRQIGAKKTHLFISVLHRLESPQPPRKIVPTQVSARDVEDCEVIAERGLPYWWQLYALLLK